MWEEFVWRVEQAYSELMAKRPNPNSKEFERVTDIMRMVRDLEIEIEAKDK